jgi:hypothetical protein
MHNPRKKLAKLQSHSITMSEDFHYEFNNNMRHAQSKEEGGLLEKKYLARSIKLIGEE